jgi:hypothetical protein
MAAMRASGRTPLEWMSGWAAMIREVADRDRGGAWFTINAEDCRMAAPAAGHLW